MRNRALVAAMICLALGASAFAGSRDTGRAERGRAPAPFLVRGLDRDAVSMTVAATGETWVAWSYRSGSEFDLALSRSDASGTWSAPEFLGRFDGDDQVQPAMAADGAGHLYLTFVIAPAGEIRLAIRPAGSDAWSVPITVSAIDERASSPTLRVVGDRLVLAYRTADGVAVTDFALYRPAAWTRGVQDGPDGFPPSGSQPMQGHQPIPSGSLR